MKFLNCLLLCALSFTVTLRAQTATTDPVGYSTITLAGNSDSYVYIPFKRTPAYVGLAAGISGNVLTISGTPNFATNPNQFVYAAGLQPKRYFVFLKSGDKAGMYFTVLNNTSNTVTLDLAGDDLSSINSQSPSIEIIPFDTLGTIFPSGLGVNPSSSHTLVNRQTEILIPDSTTAGTDLASNLSYYYYSGVAGVGPGWRKAGVASALANDEILPPDNLFRVRHNVATSTSLTFTGTVQVAKLATVLNTIDILKDQDNAVALPFATTMTLADLKLYESGAFAGSSSHQLTVRKDQVLVWDNTVTGKNKAADASYYYYTGTAGVGPGWRKSGVAGALANNDIVIGPTKGIVIRKKATNPTTAVVWSVTPPYVSTLAQ